MRLRVGVAAMAAALMGVSLVCSGAIAQDKKEPPKKGVAEMKDGKGKVVGVLNLSTYGEDVKIEGTLSGLTPGEHGFHIHEVGKCDGPGFKTAGGHYNPDGSKHGKVDGGSHAGDMDNIEAGSDGKATIEVLNGLVSLKKGDMGYLFDDDGSAVVVHAKPDDYKTQPHGDAGDRVACGVIAEKK